MKLEDHEYIRVNPIEVWKDVPEYEGLYQASNLGKVRSIRRSGSKGLKLSEQRLRGYLKCWFSKDNKVKSFLVHRVIAITFLPNSENKSQINHKNGVKDDNRVENLEWCSSQDNHAHSRIVLGKDAKGGKNPNSKLTEREVVFIRKLFAKYPNITRKFVADCLGVSDVTISDILSFKRWKYLK